MVSFTLRPGTELIGVRIINGNTTGQSYRMGRRILAVHWIFSDGSWTVQSLDVSHPGDQEVWSPPVTTDDVLMMVLSTMEPGSSETIANAVVVSHVEFLGHS